MKTLAVTNREAVTIDERFGQYKAVEGGERHEQKHQIQIEIE